MNHYQKAREQFDECWRQLYVVFSPMLTASELKVIKGLAFNAYLQGRTDEAFQQMEHVGWAIKRPFMAKEGT